MIVDERMAAVFNEWMRRFTDEPDRFKGEWETVKEYLDQLAIKEIPSYGLVCTHYFRSIAHDLFGDCPYIDIENKACKKK